MADLIIRGDLAERLTDLARREQRPEETILEGLLASYQSGTKGTAQLAYQGEQPSLSDFPVDDLGPWPTGLTLRREEM